MYTCRVCVGWVSRRSSIQSMCRVGVTEKQYTGCVCVWWGDGGSVANSVGPT